MPLLGKQNSIHEKCGHSMLNGFEIKKIVKSGAIEIVFKSWGPFRFYQLISSANLALYESNWAKLVDP